MWKVMDDVFDIFFCTTSWKSGLFPAHGQPSYVAQVPLKNSPAPGFLTTYAGEGHAQVPPGCSKYTQTFSKTGIQAQCSSSIGIH